LAESDLMPRPDQPVSGRRDLALAALARDEALGRVSRTRRWMIVAAAGLTAGLAALASALLPGKSLGAKSASTVAASTHVAPASPTGTPQLPAPASPGQLGLQGSGQAPQAATPSPQAAPQPAPVQQAAPQPAPAPSTGGGAVVSGGS
jgi:hypothetical protein